MSLNQLVDSCDVRFTLFEMLEMGKLNRYDHFKDYDRSVYEETLDLAEKIALEQFYLISRQNYNEERCIYLKLISL